MKLVKTLTIVAVTGLVGLTAVQACPSSYKGSGEKSSKSYKKSCKNDKHDKSQMRGMFKQLDLTAQQQDQMQALRKEMKIQRKVKRADKRGNRMAKMGQFVTAKGFDKEAFIAMATQKSQERINMRAEMFEKRMSILSPEQRIKFAQLLQEK